MNEAEKWSSADVADIQKPKPNILYWVKWGDHLEYLQKKQDEIERLKDDLSRAERELSAQTYRGNSIGYIYDKMLAYQGQVYPMACSLKELGFDYSNSGKDNSERESSLKEWTLKKLEEIQSLTARNKELEANNEKSDSLRFLNEVNRDKKIKELESKLVGLIDQNGKVMIDNHDLKSKLAEALVAFEPFRQRISAWRKMFSEGAIKEPLSKEWEMVEKALAKLEEK